MTDVTTQPGAIYVRVSSKEQATDGKYSLESQIEENRSKLKSLSIPCGTRPDGSPAIYGDTFTGTQTERPGAVYDRQGELIQLPGITQLVREANRYSVVAVLDRTRLGRRQAVSSQLRQQLSLQGATLRYCYGDITADRDTDLMLDAIGDVMSELELRHLQRIMAAGRKRRHEDKRLPYSGQVPFGYIIANKDAVPQQVPQEVAVVRLMAQQYLHGTLIMRIAKDPRIRNREGQPFPLNTIRRMLKNPFYAGILAWGWSKREPDSIVVGRHAPVFTTKEWRRLLAEGQRRKAIRSRGISSPRLFSGLVYCDGCHSQMQATDHRGKRYYRCPTRYRWRAAGNCPPNHIAEDLVRAAVLRRLETLASSEGFETWEDSPDPTIPTTADLQSRLDSIAQQEANLWLLQSQTGEATEGFVTALQKLQQEKTGLHVQLAQMADAPAPVLTLAERCEVLRRDYADHLAELVTPPFFDVLAARAVLRQLIPAIWVRKGEIVRVD